MNKQIINNMDHHRHNNDNDNDNNHDNDYDNDNDYDDDYDCEHKHEYDYFADIAAREEELRKINEELDLKINNVNEHRHQHHQLQPHQPNKNIKNDSNDKEVRFDDLLSFENITTSASNSNTRIKDEKKNGKSTHSRTRSHGRTRNEDQFDDNSHYHSCNGDANNDYGNNDYGNNNDGDYDITKLLDLSSQVDNYSHHTSTKNVNNIKTAKAAATTTTHLQKVQINTLNTKLKEIIHDKSQIQKSNNEYSKKLSQEQNMNRKLQLQISKLQLSMSKKENSKEDTNNEINDLRIDNSHLHKEIVTLRQIVKECELKSQSNESKMKKSLDTIQKFKTVIVSYKSRKDESELLHCKEKKEYDLKMKDMKKQNEELRNGFKKQMQLIHLLKRQKVHLEASRLLDFTEQEFMNALDWNPKTTVSTSKSSLF